MCDRKRTLTWISRDRNLLSFIENEAKQLLLPRTTTGKGQKTARVDEEIHVRHKLYNFEPKPLKMPRTCGKRRRASTCRFLCDHCGEYLSKSQYARHRELFFAESSHTRISEQGATFTAPDPFSANDSSGDEMRENATGKFYKWTTITNIHGMFAKDYIPFAS